MTETHSHINSKEDPSHKAAEVINQRVKASHRPKVHCKLVAETIEMVS
jgi:hypothetical protein